MGRWRTMIGTATLVAALASAAPAHAAYLEDAGWGTLTALTNLFYIPAKLVYATAGALTGGFAFALTGGDLQTAETVWVTTMAGTYVVSPAMLQGQEPIAFIGVPAPSGPTADSRRGLEEHPLGDS